MNQTSFNMERQTPAVSLYYHIPTIRMEMLNATFYLAVELVSMGKQNLQQNLPVFKQKLNTDTPYKIGQRYNLDWQASARLHLALIVSHSYRLTDYIAIF